MMSSRPRNASGFTLVELLVALAVSSIVIAGAVALMLGTQRLFQVTAAERHLQETARVALGHVADNLRMAGFGVDPSVAFDFGPMANVRIDRAPGGATSSAAGFACGATTGSATGLCRDRTAGPDEIVFLSRDPAFGPHPLVVAADAASTSLTVAGNASVRQGQILLVVCYTGNMSWTYVQASGPSTYDEGGGTTSIPISAGTTAFPNQNAWLADPCYGTVAAAGAGAAALSTAAEVFKVDRYRYFIASYDRAGALRPWGTPGSRPFLMLDQGLVTQGGPLVTPLVPDVEDLQFAYVFPEDAATPVVGATAGAAITNAASGIDLVPGGPVFSDASTAPARQTHHPGNIGAVRVSVVVRSPSADPSRPSSSTIPAAGNRDATPGEPGHLRLHVETTVAIPNLSARHPYYPTYLGTTTAPSGARQLNVGGG